MDSKNKWPLWAAESQATSFAQCAKMYILVKDHRSQSYQGYKGHSPFYQGCLNHWQLEYWGQKGQEYQGHRG